MIMTWWQLRRIGVLSALSVVLILQGLGDTPRQVVKADTASPACPAAETTSLARFPQGHGVCVPVGLTPLQMVEDDSIGHALVFNTWDPSATIIDVRTGRVIRTMSLGSKYDFVYLAVDPRTHHFFLSLQRGKYSSGGGNQVYMIDARTGAVLLSLRCSSALGSGGRQRP